MVHLVHHIMSCLLKEINAQNLKELADHHENVGFRSWHIPLTIKDDMIRIRTLKTLWKQMYPSEFDK